MMQKKTSRFVGNGYIVPGDSLGTGSRAICCVQCCQYNDGARILANWAIDRSASHIAGKGNS